MEDLFWVYGTAGLILAFFTACVLSRKLDPFAPVWLFLVGYTQLYVIQAFSYHEWAVEARGKDLVTAANFRAFWALAWFLMIYQLPLGQFFAQHLPRPPSGWSSGLVTALGPPLVVWGLFCAGILIVGSGTIDERSLSPEQSLFMSFPFVMMVTAVLLIVTGRTAHLSRPIFLPVGLCVALAYVMIWIYNGKRSHALIGVLASLCGFYVARQKRPSWLVLVGTSFVGAVVVAAALGWRNNLDYDRTFTGLLHYLGDFQVEKVLDSLNLGKRDEDLEDYTFETEEYGGFLLMMDTVPLRSPYDYGASYLRLVSTFIPRVLWPSKPLFGRAQWVSAWMAGSKMERDEDFTGPAIGILGATQLNGGAIGTVTVLACVALVLRTAYEFFRLNAHVTWAQFWWSITYFNAWFMVVNDDPLVWFYYNWGFTALPVAVVMWCGSRFIRPRSAHDMVATASA
jgi:hypothetical protein